MRRPGPSGPTVPALMSVSEAGSAPCQPHASSAVRIVDVERLAVLFPAEASPGEGNPARQIEPFPGEDFPRKLAPRGVRPG